METMNLDLIFHNRLDFSPWIILLLVYKLNSHMYIWRLAFHTDAKENTHTFRIQRPPGAQTSGRNPHTCYPQLEVGSGSSRRKGQTVKRNKTKQTDCLVGCPRLTNSPSRSGCTQGQTTKGLRALEVGNHRCPACHTRRLPGSCPGSHLLPADMKGHLCHRCRLTCVAAQAHLLKS